MVGLYVRAYEVDLGEAVPPDGSFPSFDAFFTRALREGARPSRPTPTPSSARPTAGSRTPGRSHAGGALRSRAGDYAVADLVGDAAEVARYEGGQFAIVYLSPRDYHRVHAPVAGQITLRPVAARAICSPSTPSASGTSPRCSRPTDASRS